MYLVHEPESIRFWHGNELFTSNSRSFHGMFMAALCSLTDCVGEDGENGWLQLLSLVSCHHSFISH